MAPSRMSNCSRRPDSSRLDTLQSARDAFGGGESDDGRRGAGLGNPRCRLIAVKTRQMTPVFILFVFELLFFPRWRRHSKMSAGKTRQAGEICRVAVKYFLKTEAFLRCIVLCSELRLKVAAAHIFNCFPPSSNTKQPASFGFICIMF